MAWLCLLLLSQAARRQVEVTAEEAAHMCLVAEAAGMRDLGQGHVIGEDHIAGALYAMATNQRGRRQVKRYSKGMSEA